MFKKLVNEATVRFVLSVDGPLLINEPAGSKIDPTIPDMSCVRSNHNGIKTVYIPGSSIKGVFRSRYEQLLTAMGDFKVCNIFDMDKGAKRETRSCSVRVRKNNAEDKGVQRYQESCDACKLFGNLILGSRVSFTDAYPLPDTDLILGIRHGVGIDRITGAAFGKALYDIEVVESGRFQFEIHLQNFELSQLYLLLFIIQDIDEGKVTFGMGGSRGNGHMRLDDFQKFEVVYRLFEKTEKTRMRGYWPEDIGSEVEYINNPFYNEFIFHNLDDVYRAIEPAVERKFGVKK